MNKFHQLKAPPIFIVGAARSGTTWVHNIFKNHPLVASIYESWLFTPDHGLQPLFNEAHNPDGRSGLGNVMVREQRLALVRDLAINIMSNVIEPHHQFLVEKSPSHVFAVPFIREVFPDSRFIHVIRDGRDVNVSVQAAVNSWMPYWKNSFGASIRVSASAWKSAVNQFRLQTPSLGQDFIEVRYEEIHAEPVKLYKRMFDFCEIPYDDRILADIFQATDFELNYRGGEDKFRRGGRIGDWRTRFSSLDALIFKRVAGDLLIELGYENDYKWLPENKWKLW